MCVGEKEWLPHKAGKEHAMAEPFRQSCYFKGSSTWLNLGFFLDWQWECLSSTGRKFHFQWNRTANLVGRQSKVGLFHLSVVFVMFNSPCGTISISCTISWNFFFPSFWLPPKSSYANAYPVVFKFTLSWVRNSQYCFLLRCQSCRCLLWWKILLELALCIKERQSIPFGDLILIIQTGFCLPVFHKTFTVP